MSTTHKPLDIFFIVDGSARKGTLWLGNDLSQTLSPKHIDQIKAEVRANFEKDQAPEGAEAFTAPPIRISVTHYTRVRWNPFSNADLEGLFEDLKRHVAANYNFDQETAPPTPEQVVEAFMTEDYSDSRLHLALVALAMQTNDTDQVPFRILVDNGLDAIALMSAYSQGTKTCWQCDRPECDVQIALDALAFFEDWRQDRPSIGLNVGQSVPEMTAD